MSFLFFFFFSQLFSFFLNFFFYIFFLVGFLFLSFLVFFVFVCLFLFFSAFPGCFSLGADTFFSSLFCFLNLILPGPESAHKMAL